MTKTTLIITTRDRPQFLQLVVETAFKQTRPFHQIIISDNSSSNYFRSKNKSLLEPYLVRYPDHLELVQTPYNFPSGPGHAKYIQETFVDGADFCIIFHDDDEMLPHYHETALKILKSEKELVAVGCNALKLNDTKLTHGTVMRKTEGLEFVKNSKQLLKYYMGIGPISAPPLCGYLFKTRVFKLIPFENNTGGKYSDVVTLTEATKFGPMIWSCEPLMKYRIHSMQDSKIVSTLDFRNLLNYMVKKGKFSSNSIYVQSYRFKHFRLKFKSFLKSGKWHSAKVVSIYLIYYTLRKLIWRKQTYGYFWSKITHK